MKNISILGSTGSIGVNTLDVIARNPTRFKVVALAAGRNLSLFKRQIDIFGPDIVSVPVMNVLIPGRGSRIPGIFPGMETVYTSTCRKAGKYDWKKLLCRARKAMR